MWHKPILYQSDMPWVILGLICLKEDTLGLLFGLLAHRPDGLKELIQSVWVDVYRRLDIEPLLGLRRHDDMSCCAETESSVKEGWHSIYQ